MGFFFSGVCPQVAASNQINEEASFRNRVVGERLVPNDEAWDELMLVADLLMPYMTIVQPVSFEEWVQRFQGNKQNQLRQVNEKLNGKIPSKRELKRYNCFVKREIKLAYAAFKLIEQVCPRNIMSAKDVVKILLGVHFYSYSKYCHKHFSNKCDIYYEPGGLANEVTDWVLQKQEWPLLENDFSRFDRSNGLRSTQLKINYAKKLGLRGESLRIYELLLENSKFTSRHGVVCVRQPGTLSGHPDTTWSNTMINLTVQWYCIAKAWQQREHKQTPFKELIKHPDFPMPGSHFRLAACGDDALGRVRPDYADKQGFLEAGKLLGYKMKLKLGHPLTQARFCSNAFYPTLNGGYLMAPTMKCVLKLGSTISSVGNQGVDAQKAHMRGVALGLLKQTNHVPILNDYIQSVLRWTQGSKGRYLNEAKREAARKYRQVEEAQQEPPHAVTYLAQMYGVSENVLHQLRNEIANMNEPGIYDSSAIEQFVKAVARVEDI